MPGKPGHRARTDVRVRSGLRGDPGKLVEGAAAEGLNLIGPAFALSPCFKAEKKIPILIDRTTDRYINTLGKRLADVAPGADYNYQFRGDRSVMPVPGVGLRRADELLEDFVAAGGHLVRETFLPAVGREAGHVGAGL